MTAITVGAGKTGYGLLHELNGAPPAESVKAFLESLPPEQSMTWWAPTRWTNHHRKKANWEGAFGAVVDVDWYDEHGEHTTMPAAKAAAVQDAPLPGSLLHLTPGGIRLAFIYSGEETDAARGAKASLGAGAMIRDALQRAGLHASFRSDGSPVNGLSVDEAALKDRARFFWAPRTASDDKGRRRDAEVILLRAEPYTAADLAGHAPDDRRERRKVRAELNRQCAAVRQAPSGERNHILNRSSFALGQLVGYGALPEDEVIEALRAAAHDAGLDDGEIEKTIRSGLDAGRAEPRSPYRRAGVSDGDKPTFLVEVDLAAAVDFAEEVLGTTESGVYQRHVILVHVTKLLEGGSTIRPLADETLRERAGRAATWTRVGETGDIIEIQPPTWVAPTLSKRGQWSKIPHLRAIASNPVILPDGTVLDESDFHREYGMLLEFNPADFPPLPDITDANARDIACVAAAELLDPFSEFPFKDLGAVPDERGIVVSDSSRGAFVASVLTMAGPQSFDGPSPLFASLSSTAGTGKTLLIRAACITGTGSEPFLQAVPDKSEEMGKILVSHLIEGTPVILFDNAVSTFGTAEISAALTSDTFGGRVLGYSRNVRGPFRSVVALSGNNLSFVKDAPRRIVPIYLDAESEDPEGRRFRIKDLIAHVKANRGRLFMHAMTILRCFHVAGRPEHGDPAMGSYEAWDSTIRAAVRWIGVGDPCGSRDAIRQEADPERDKLRNLLGAIHDRFGSDAFTARELIAHGTETDIGQPLRDALVGIQPRGKTELTAEGIGYGLRKFKNQVVKLGESTDPAFYRLVQTRETRQHAHLWRVEEVRHA